MDSDFFLRAHPPYPSFQFNKMECRFYNNALPQVDDVIMVQVKSFTDIGAYVSLLEYGRVEGMIQITEMSSRRIRSISKLTKIGNIEVVTVLRVDADRGYIDLSKKRMANEGCVKAKELFAKNKTVHGIMRHISTIVDRPVEAVCEAIAWPLYKEFGRGGHKVYDVLRRMINDNSIEQVAKICPELARDTPLKDALMLAAGRKLTPHQVRVRALFECTCFAADGVNAIKQSITEAKAECAADGLTIKLVSAPQFLIETSGIGKEACAARIDNALKCIESKLVALGGNYKLRSPPDVIGDDEEDLPKLENDDVSSDEEEEDVERSEGDSSEDEDSSDSSSSSEDEAPKKRKGKK